MQRRSQLLIAAAMVFGAMQLLPLFGSRSNPPVVKEPPWDSPQTRDLVKRACFDCHSNETVWPWYARVAPVSWLLARDVNGGRRRLNFSQWNQPQRHARDVAREISSGDMPLWFYLPMHPAARLTPEEKQLLLDGVTRTFGPQNASKP